jgi:hypothetical protein
VAPPPDNTDLHRHTFRELNADADSKANLGRTDGRVSWYRPVRAPPPFVRVCLMGATKMVNVALALLLLQAPTHKPPMTDGLRLLGSLSDYKFDHGCRIRGCSGGANFHPDFT